MAMTDAEKRAQAKYRKENSKLITVQVPLREWETINEYCERTGEGKSTMIRRLIAEEMERFPDGRASS